MDQQVEKSLLLDSNKKACILIIESIAKFPQHDSGAPILIIDKLINHIQNPTPRSVSIKELAQIEPERNWCAEKINQIHKQFGIEYQVNPIQAESFVMSFAIKSLDYLKRKTVSIANELNIQIPAELKEDTISKSEQILVKQEGSNSYYQRISRINKTNAFTLQNFLENNSELRVKLANLIKPEAEKIKSESKKQQYENRGN